MHYPIVFTMGTIHPKGDRTCGDSSSLWYIIYVIIFKLSIACPENVLYDFTPPTTSSTIDPR